VPLARARRARSSVPASHSLHHLAAARQSITRSIPADSARTGARFKAVLNTECCWSTFSANAGGGGGRGAPRSPVRVRPALTALLERTERGAV